MNVFDVGRMLNRCRAGAAAKFQNMHIGVEIRLGFGELSLIALFIRDWAFGVTLCLFIPELFRCAHMFSPTADKSMQVQYSRRRLLRYIPKISLAIPVLPNQFLRHPDRVS